jgi:TRAP-type mannitol/chloroaromatic compound transport system substrate-binding protein
MARMTRRRFIKNAGVAGATAAAIASPAIAQSSPTIRWRLTTSWPKSLDALYGSAEHFARFVAEATDNKFVMQTFAAGEIVPALQATDAVSSGSVEACHTAPYYMWGKDPTFALACAVPFGLNGRMQNAWWRDGGGEQLVNAFYAKHNIVGLLAGNTMAQMGGWFRREVNTPDDLKGIKMRIAGFAGAVMAKVGVITQQIAGGDIYPALEKGTVDAAEWVGPYDDEKLGFYKVARFYYYPGWWEGGTMIHVHINKAKWDELPKYYQTILKAAAAEANNYTVARYDAGNPQALKRLVAAGTQLRPFSEATLDVCHRASNEIYAEISAKNEDFKKIWDSIKAFRLDQYLWLQVADGTYDNYMMTQHRKQAL